MVVLFEGIQSFPAFNVKFKLIVIAHSVGEETQKFVAEIIGYNLISWEELPRLYCDLFGFKMKVTQGDEISGRIPNNSEQQQLNNKVVHSLLLQLSLREDEEKLNYEICLIKGHDSGKENHFSENKIEEFSIVVCDKPANLIPFQHEAKQHSRSVV